MTDTEHDEREGLALQPVPSWITPILAREAEKRVDARTQRDDEGRYAAIAINRYLGILGIEPLSPAEWTPSDGLRKAVLLEPNHCDIDEWGVRVGWDGEITLYAVDGESGIERIVGPLNNIEDAADARRGPRALPPEPMNHELAAEEEVQAARHFHVADEDPFEVAFLAGLRAQTHALLALNDTVSRLGVRQALRQAAALGQIPLDQVALTTDEKRLLREIFPPHYADANADAEQIGELSALDGA